MMTRFGLGSTLRLLPWCLAACAVACVCANPADAADPPKAESFLGKWVGKWDGKWKVQFTVSRISGADLSVLYEWEELAGQPLERNALPGQMRKGVLLVGDFIEITLAAKDPNRAKAVGNFRKRRTAELTREIPPPRKQP